MKNNILQLARNSFVKGIAFAAGFAVTGLLAFSFSNGFYTFQTGDPVSADQINHNFMMVNAPVGTIVAWHKNIKGPDGALSLPENWVECNGGFVNDPDSTINGYPIPDLNHPYNGLTYYQKGVFLRGDITSGLFEEDMMQGHWHDDAKHSHSISIHDAAGPDHIGWTPGALGPYTKQTSESKANVRNPISDGYNNSPRTGLETRPVNMSVVWIMKIK